MANPIQSEYSIEDLEQFRDENGFIDITKAGIEFTDESREMGGNTDRVKNWVSLKGKRFLIKGEAILETEKNYGIYAELIMEEVGKQLGIPVAHYDLVKYTDENGKEAHGVLSESVLNREAPGAYMVSLHDLIGDVPNEPNDDFDKTNMDSALTALRENLERTGYSQEVVESTILDFKKRMVLSMAIMQTDNHPENYSFIKYKEDGVDKIKLAPIYDSESSFLLDMDEPTVAKMVENIEGLRKATFLAEPKIGIKIPEEEGGFDSYWRDTAARFLLSEKEYDVSDYFFDHIRSKIDMDQAFENVEKRIHAELPKQVKLLAKFAYLYRNKDMARIMDEELVPENQYQIFEKLNYEDRSYDDGPSLLEGFMARINNEGIRKSEQTETSHRLEDMLSKLSDLNLDDIEPDKDDEHDLEDN